MCILNRTLRYVLSDGFIAYEADQRHPELNVETLGLESAKEVATPSEKHTATKVLTSQSTPLLTSEGQTLYRSLVMRAAYLGQDRPGLPECTKTLARSMQSPKEADLQDLQRLGRYLKGRNNWYTITHGSMCAILMCIAIQTGLVA